jgi:hypothetical protein
MIKKRGVVVLALILSIFLVSFISAADNETNTTTTSATGSFEKGYSCLKEQINAKVPATTEELAFSILALGYDPAQQSKLKSALDALGSNGECWPKTGCTIKDTSLVLLAYNHIYQSTAKIENWLMNKTAPASDLVWYLQIDNLNNNKSKCTITYDGSAKNILIDENKVITGTPGACLKFAQNGYWLEVASNCYGKNFDISCDADFLTSTFYKRKTDQIYYITTTTHTASPNGKTSEKVNSVCFYQGGCNYEGSLWATYALNKKGKDIKPMLPYLISLAKDNQRYLPSSFLFSLTGFDEYFADLTGKQDKKGYWQISETGRRYYDTSVSILSLYGRASDQADRAIQYLLDPTVQAANGCWNGNNIRDTAFILYSASPKVASSGDAKQCKDVAEFSCIASTACENINGSVQSEYTCFGGSICCNKKVAEKTCSEKSGKICLSSQECSSGFVTASSTSYCCLGDCIEPQVIEDTCTTEGADYSCNVQCGGDEDERSSLTCPEKAMCCVKKPIETSSFPWGMIILLIILIALIVLGIIYRDQLRVWWFKFQSKFKKGPVSGQQRPGMPPMGGVRPPMGMPPRPGMFQRPMAPPVKPFGKQNELDDTLKKLKDMSK